MLVFPKSSQPNNVKRGKNEKNTIVSRDFDNCITAREVR
jgi:hypothetical protein